MAEYKRQGSIDDENFLYLAESEKESNKDLSDNMNTCLVNIQTSINNGSEKIKDSIDNIELKCDNSDIVEEMQNESIGDKLEEIKNAILSGGSSEEIIEEIEEIKTSIESIQEYLDYFTDLILRRYDEPTHDGYLSEYLEIKEWDKENNRSVRFGPVCNLRLDFWLSSNQGFTSETYYDIMAIAGKMIPERTITIPIRSVYGAIFELSITGYGRVQISSDSTKTIEDEHIRANITYVNYQLEKDWESEDN